MRPGGHQTPSEQKHAEKRRFEEKGHQAFVGQKRRDHVGGGVGEAAPIGAELERHNDAGDHAHAEGNGIESAAGVAAGGRTGLTALFVAICFLAALFFAPLAGMVPAYASSAALLYVACVMARSLAEMDWDDITETAPAVVAAVTMPLTYSIATGIGLGFITYALIKLIAGRFADAKPAVLVLALIFAVKFALG